MKLMGSIFNRYLVTEVVTIVGIRIGSSLYSYGPAFAGFLSVGFFLVWFPLAVVSNHCAVFSSKQRFESGKFLAAPTCGIFIWFIEVIFMDGDMSPSVSGILTGVSVIA